VTCLIINDLF